MTEIDEPQIRAALSLLTFQEPYQTGSEFVDFTPSVPPAYQRLEGHDLMSGSPPAGMAAQEYAALAPTFVILQAALSEHDELVGSEETERIRETFWAAYGDPDTHGADVLRRRYLRLLGDRVLRTLQEEGETGLRWIATYRQIWTELGGKITGSAAG